MSEPLKPSLDRTRVDAVANTAALLLAYMVEEDENGTREG